MSPSLILALHFVGLFCFLLEHGTSAGLAMSLRGEREPSRMRRLLETSEGSFSLAYLGLLIVVATGLYGAFELGYWRQGWVWASVALLLVIIGVMWTLGGGRYSQVRKPLGIKYREGFKVISEPAPESTADAQEAADRQMSWLLLATGAGALGVLLCLMIWKPF